MHQSGDDHKQHAHYRYRCLTDTRQRLFRIQHTGHIQDTYRDQKYHIGTYPREEQHRKHSKDRHNSDPRIHPKT